MKQTFECVEKHLYRRQYQTAGGDWSTLYYVIFTDWKKKRRTFPVGSDLKTAREECKVLEARNIRREDFEKAERAKGLTYGEWAKLYFKEKVDPEKRASGVERERRSSKKLECFFGQILLSDINRGKINEYRIKRLQEPIVRRGKPVEGSKISFPTVNRELAFLRYLLNLAVDAEIIDNVPSFRKLIQSEKNRKRDRVATVEEYQALLSYMKRPAQRVLIALHESAMRPKKPINLTWDRIDEKAGLIKLKAEDVKEKAPRNVPISLPLRAILQELREEQRKIPNIGNRVFTRNGRPMKSIRKAFELACKHANIEDLHLHDFRHTCITNWTKVGVPAAIVMAASGHHSIETHKTYVNIKERDIQNAFKDLFTTFQHEKPIELKAAVSYGNV
jgi:integrase